MRAICLALTAWIALSSTGAIAAPPIVKAETVTVVPGDKPVTANAPLGASGASVMRILREVYPDLGADGKGNSIAAVRALPDAVDTDRPAGTLDVNVGAYESFVGGPVWSVVVGEDAFVMMAGVLIGAQISPDYRFLDSLFVQTDPGGLPVLEKGFEIAPGNAAVMVANRHYNSQEAFEEYRLIGYRYGNLAQLAPAISLYSLSAAEGNCERKDIVQKLEGPTTAPGKPGEPMDLLFTVVETHACRTGIHADGPIKKVPGGRRYPIRWKWNAATEAYVGGSAELEKVNGERRGG